MNAIFRSIMDVIYSVVVSHGWTVVLFTILIKLILMPFDYKSRKSMRRMEKVNPQLQALQKKYANDKEKLQRKQAELYKKEKISPIGSCLPMLLTLPVFFIMLAAMRSVANEELVKLLLTIKDAVGTYTLDEAEAIHARLPALNTLMEPFLWIKNLWLPDSPFASVLPNSSSALAAVGASIEGLISADEMISLKEFIDGNIYQSVVLSYYGALPLKGGALNFLFFTLTLYGNWNGLFILPVLSAVTQFLQTTLTPQPQAQQPQPDAQGGQSAQPGMGNFMKYFFPIFSIWICATSTAAFSLYWVVSNITSVVQQVAFKYYFEAQDRKAAAQTEEVDKL